MTHSGFKTHTDLIIWELSFSSEHGSDNVALQRIIRMDSPLTHDSLLYFVLHLKGKNPARMSHELNPGGIQSSCGT